MTTPRDPWPRKTREVQDAHFDSRAWNDFAFRDGDIVIASYDRSSTPWARQIVGQLLFGGAADVPVDELAPWLDVPPAAEKLALLAAQTHRRFVVTQLPVDALVYSPRAKYLYVARDGRDVACSVEAPTADVRRYLLDCLDHGGDTCGSFWAHVRSWWAIRDLPNLLLVHVADWHASPERAIRRIAEFLGVPIYPDRWPAILRHCSFDWMERQAGLSVTSSAVPAGDGDSAVADLTGGWRDALGFEDVVRYEATAERELGLECARWLAHGLRAG